MFYFYLAYSILWIILIIYVFIIVNRQSNLEKELESLKMTLERLTK
ncbi:MAG: CcmD family protein [Bacillota bacterium]